MNKRLVRIISGAAAGAAAAYLLSSKNRNGLLTGIRDLSDSVTGLFGSENGGMQASATPGRTGASNSSNSAGGRTQSRGAGRPKGSGNAASRRG